MKRHQRFFIFAFMVISAYLSLRKITETQTMLPLSLQAHFTTIKFLVNALPWYILIAFGCYCLGKLGIDLLSFKDCPQEIPKLAEEVEQARKWLASKGFKQR